MIKLLTFDLDNTLWDVDAIIPRANKAMRDWIRQEHGDFAAQFNFNDMMPLLMQVAKEHPAIAHDFTQLRMEVLRRAFRQGGYTERAAEEAAEGAFLAFFHERNRVNFFPHVMDKLPLLKEEFLLYSISNGNADIRLTGLSDFISRHFSAINTGFAKPDPRIFSAAIQAADCAPYEVVHIGDDPVLDVEAAAAVGMKTVWVNYHQHAWPVEKAPADAVIHSFDELPSVLAQLKRSA